MLSGLRVTLQWIHAHCQVHGKEMADTLAKSGGRLELVEQPTSHPEGKTRINTAWRKVREAVDPCYSHSIDHNYAQAVKKAPKSYLEAQVRPCCLQGTFIQSQLSCLPLRVHRANGRAKFSFSFYRTDQILRLQDKTHGLHQTP